MDASAKEAAYDCPRCGRSGLGASMMILWSGPENLWKPLACKGCHAGASAEERRAVFPQAGGGGAITGGGSVTRPPGADAEPSAA